LNGWERVSKSFYFRLMFQNEIPSVFLFCEIVQNGILSIFIFHGMVLNKITKFRAFFLFYEMVRNGILIIFNSRRMAWNRIPSFFSSAKQTEFQWNESKFPSVPCSTEYLFSRKMPTLAQKIGAWRAHSRGMQSDQRMPPPSG
jgi:hypothetical protein